MNHTVSLIAKVVAVTAATTLASVAQPAVGHAADTCVDSGTGAPLPLDAPPCSDVLAQEARWLVAITSGDVAAVDSILSPTYLHINADGIQIGRAEELATTAPLDLTFRASDQIVDVSGDTAVIHGINNLMRGGKLVERQRFTDVFLLQNGTWKASSAQETKIP